MAANITFAKGSESVTIYTENVSDGLKNSLIILPIKLVTVKGEVLTKTSIIGGSLPKDCDSSLLGRWEKVAQGLAELDKIKQEKAELSNAHVRLESEIKELSSLIQQKEPDLNKLKIKVANKESELANIVQDKKRFQDEISVLNMELEETREQLKQLGSEQHDLNQQILQQGQRHKQIQDSIQGSQDLIVEKLSLVL